MAVTSPAPAPQGHCSQCGKVWTLKERQGVCQWCNKPASCQSSTSKPRQVKSSRRQRQKQADHNGNGYDQLDGEYLTYYKVASQFSHKAQAQDIEDLLHTIIANLADAGRNNGHKPDNASWMYRIASFSVAQYWRTYYKLTNGLTCGNCSKAKRDKCKGDYLYTECPKAIKLDYLSKPVIGEGGELTELGELIADDKALDLDAWLDNRTFLLGCPQRLIDIAQKKLDEIPLDGKDQDYLDHWRKKSQKRLF